VEFVSDIEPSTKIHTGEQKKDDVLLEVVSTDSQPAETIGLSAANTGGSVKKLF